MLGFRAHEANRSAKAFFVHDEKTLKQLSTIRNEDEYISAIRENIEEFELVLQADQASVMLRADEAWDEQQRNIGLETVG